jgi:outer membrane protein assembly factor BamB
MVTTLLLTAAPSAVVSSSLARAPRSCVHPTRPSGRTLALVASIVLGAAVPALAVAAAPVATADTWPSWRGDGGQTGRSPSALADRLSVLWTYKAGDAILSSAVVDATRVYFGSKDGGIHAVDRATGKMRWLVPAGGPVEAPPLVVDGLLVIGGRDGVVRTLEVNTGAERWRFAAGAEVVAAASWVAPRAGLGAGVLVGGYDGTLHMLDLATGAQRWTFSTGSYFYGSPAITAENAVIGGCDGFVHTVDLDDGKELARVEVGAYVGASVAVEGGQGFVGHFGNRVIGFDVLTGAVSWSAFDRSFPYLSSAALTPEIAVLGGRDHVVRALSRKTGEVWWMFPGSEKFDSSPVIVGSRAVIGSEDGRVYLLDLEDGSEKASVDLGAPVAASPAVASGVVYIGTTDGSFYAIGGKGKVKP